MGRVNEREDYAPADWSIGPSFAGLLPAGSGARRRNATTKLAAALLLSCSLVACGGSGGGKDDDVDLEPFRAAREAADLADCTCRVELGMFANSDECINEISPRSTDTKYCMEDVGEDYGSLEVHLNTCTREIEENLTVCLQSSCTATHYDSCFASYRVEYALCEQIESEAYRRLRRCF